MAVRCSSLKAPAAAGEKMKKVDPPSACSRSASAPRRHDRGLVPTSPSDDPALGDDRRRLHQVALFASGPVEQREPEGKMSTSQQGEVVR